MNFAPYTGLAIFTWPRNVGGLIAHVTIEELARDMLEITRHPVEYGATISDHAFKLPTELQITAGWSASRPEAAGDPAFLRTVYDAFLRLQADRTPFSITTGKANYDNMLLHTVSNTTDAKTEESLLLVLQCRQVILVNTQKITVPSPAVSKVPQTTGSPVNRGPQGAASPKSLNSAGAVLMTPPQNIIRRTGVQP